MTSRYTAIPYRMPSVGATEPQIHQDPPPPRYIPWVAIAGEPSMQKCIGMLKRCAGNPYVMYLGRNTGVPFTSSFTVLEGSKRYSSSN